MHLHSTHRFALALVIGVLVSSTSLVAAQDVQVRSTQLELGLTGALPLASSSYEGQARYGGSLAARFALSRGRFVFDAGVDAGGLWVDKRWGGWRIDEAQVVRLRAMVGVRYAFVSAARAQLYGRLGAGVEGRIARYDLYLDDYPLRERDLSWAPVIESSIGLRLGGAHRFALLQVGLPIALHSKHAIQAFGSSDSSLAVELAASVFVGWTL